jgi:hypothetical protein
MEYPFTIGAAGPINKIEDALTIGPAALKNKIEYPFKIGAAACTNKIEYSFGIGAAADLDEIKNLFTIEPAAFQLQFSIPLRYEQPLSQIYFFPEQFVNKIYLYVFCTNSIF